MCWQRRSAATSVVVRADAAAGHERGRGLVRRHPRGALARSARRVEDGRFPLVLAGNCYSSRRNRRRRSAVSVGVVWFDAHGDFHTPDSTPTGFFDGMPLAMLTGDGWAELRGRRRGAAAAEEANRPRRRARPGADGEAAPGSLGRAAPCRTRTARGRARRARRRGSAPSTSTSTSTCSTRPRRSAQPLLAVEGGLTADSSSRRSPPMLEPLRDAAPRSHRLRPERGPGRGPRAGESPSDSQDSSRAEKVARDRRRLDLPLRAARRGAADHARRQRWLSRRAAGYLATARSSSRSSPRSSPSSTMLGAAGTTAHASRPPGRGSPPGDFHVGLSHPRRPAGGLHDADRLRRRRADRRLLDRLHGRRRRGAPLLRVHGAVRLLDAAARPGREPAAAARRLGHGRPLLATC